jgi:hypothetical protein
VFFNADASYTITIVPTPKYQKQYLEMLKINRKVFEELKLKSAKRNSLEFKEIQLKALRIVRRNEDLLCSKTENTKFSNFSLGLSDKFWELVRADYPEIDYSVE